MSVLKVYACSYPSVLIPQIGKGEEKKISSLLRAYEKMAEEIQAQKPETIVFVSPLAPSYPQAFYLSPLGTGESRQGRFQDKKIELSCRYDDSYADQLKRLCRREKIDLFSLPCYDSEIDEAMTVPLYFIQKRYRDFRVLRLGLSMLSFKKHEEVGEKIAECADFLARRTVLISLGQLSTHSCDGGNEHRRPEAARFDAEICRLFKRGELEKLRYLDPKFCLRANATDVRSFIVAAGALKQTKYEADLRSYEAAYGRGYVFASFEVKAKRDAGERAAGKSVNVHSGSAASLPQLAMKKGLNLRADGRSAAGTSSDFRNGGESARTQVAKGASPEERSLYESRLGKSTPQIILDGKEPEGSSSVARAGLAEAATRQESETARSKYEEKLARKLQGGNGSGDAAGAQSGAAAPPTSSNGEAKEESEEMSGAGAAAWLARHRITGREDLASKEARFSENAVQTASASAKEKEAAASSLANADSALPPSPPDGEFDSRGPRQDAVSEMDKCGRKKNFEAEAPAPSGETKLPSPEPSSEREATSESLSVAATKSAPTGSARGADSAAVSAPAAMPKRGTDEARQTTAPSDSETSLSGRAVAAEEAFSNQNGSIYRLPLQGDPLVELAVFAIRYFVQYGTKAPLPRNIPEKYLHTKAACFISVYLHRQLLGCIGTVDAQCDNLAEEVIHNALAACRRDQRFRLKTLRDARQLRATVDVLSPTEQVTRLDQLDPQQYGVVVTKGERRGLLLPRLAGVDTVEQQLGIAATKAGVDVRLVERVDRFSVERHI